MSKQSDPKDKTNFIENLEERARELFGYDDESLLRELKAAELELELMKAEDPELEAQIKAETDAGFDALMQKIHAENIKPVTEREYSEKKREEERKVTMLRPFLKVMFVAAAILVVLSGMGVVVSARKEFEYQYVSGGKTKNEAISRNGDYEREVGQLDEAYQQIKDSLGINVLIIKNKPAGLKYEGLYVDENKGHARLKFQYENNAVYLKETRHPSDKVSDNVVSDRKSLEPVFNPWLEHDFIIEEGHVEGNLIEYSTKLEQDGAYYYLAGIMDKTEFIEIVKSLAFLQ